jgi:hypothetical protein
MVKLFDRGVVSFGGVASLLAACASGSDMSGGSGDPSGAPAQSYTIVCAVTSCDSCRDDAADRYSECLRLCSDPYAPSGCFAQCPSIGDSSCSYACGANERCEQWRADLPWPGRDEHLLAECVQFMLGCSEVTQEYADTRCDKEARVKQPSFADVYACLNEHACDRDEAGGCRTLPEPGTTGTLLCQRATVCGAPCRPGDERSKGDEALMNSVEANLRPSIIEVARQCAAEETCSKFLACKEALDRLWYWI